MPKKPNKSYKHINRYDWTKVKDWKYPYKDYGLYGCLNDPKYIKNKSELFNINGNGWWWGNGWWNNKTETLMEYNRRLKREKRSIK